MPETAPERIWAWKDQEYDATLWNDHGDRRYTPPIATEYVRADLLDEAVQVLEAVLTDGSGGTSALWVPQAREVLAKLRSKT